MEIWKDIEGYEGLYKVSSDGRVMSFYRGEKPLFPLRTTSGYLMVYLTKNRKAKYKAVHRLVASAFVPNPHQKTQVNHIDGNKHNNCANNLEWVTPSENVLHAHRVLCVPSSMLSRKGENNKNSIPVCQYDLNGNFLKQWAGVSDAARGIGCNPCQIQNVIAGRSLTCHGFMWSYIKLDKIDNSRIKNKRTHKNFL